jgi:hypothetical protein
VRNAGVAVNLRFGGITEGPYRPIVRNIDVTQLTCLRSTNALTLSGLPDSLVANVALSDSSFGNVSGAGVVQSNATGLRLANVTINGTIVDN